MSNMKNGFSTLNRWLGKKNKDKSAANGKLSKSSTNLSLSVSTTNINETSQLEYNRITPLPAATSNAPFEQTFRITVLLPKDQLYVSRLGARVPLSKLLELVCENKLLDAEKYEFRNPVDPSQVYSCNLTIGSVGLSEIRLCHKSESYDTFNAEEVIKLHRTSIIRDSLSSSEFSSHNSKHTTKTASPYSSSNSLNSMDSTGVNFTRTVVKAPPTLPATAPPKITAPPRKKRAAPRPPSQLVIPEKSALIITNTELTAIDHTIGSLQDTTLPRKDYYVSTPNLASSTLLSADISNTDCNGNSKIHNDNNNEVAQNGRVVLEHDGEIQTVEQKNARNIYGGSVQNLSSMPASDMQSIFPEPSPRKRLIMLKKKSAPAPPARGSLFSDDTISIGSSTTAASTPGTPITPTAPDTPLAMSTAVIAETVVTPASVQTPASNVSVATVNVTENSIKPSAEPPTPLARESTAATKPLQTSTPVLVETTAAEPNKELPQNIPKPVPRLTTTTLINATNVELADSETQPATHHTNVSKVMLNRTPTPEPRSLSTEPPELNSSSLATHISELHNDNTYEHDDDNASKQADSGIGEPVPSPIPDSLPSEGSTHDVKSTFESSSDDDDMIKVYNFKLGKTLLKPVGEHKTLEDLTVIAAAESISGESTPATLTHESTNNISDASSWNFSIPISPPPNFADTKKFMQELESNQLPDTPITPKIKERPLLNFAALTPEDNTKKIVAEKREDNISVAKPAITPLQSPQTPIDDIVTELNNIISEQRMDSLIKKAEKQPEIESAKPNTLSNFSITPINQQQTPKPPAEEVTLSNGQETPTTPDSTTDEEKIYRKRSSNSILKQRRSITRADSFHATVTQNSSATKTTDTSLENGTRSASYLSLNKLDFNTLQFNQRRRSSSELSIGESPSLQSLEIIKTILNSRKNSLANSSSSEGESKQESPQIISQTETKSLNNRVETTAQITSVESPPKTEVKAHDAMPKPEETVKPKDLPKVYRYSGPPSINFSTWNERPKVQVSIKNEGDYIFGGKNSGNQNAAVTNAAVEIQMHSMPRNYRASTPAGTLVQHATESNTTPPPVAPKPESPIKRMGIPEKEFHVPVTVKPLKDVTIESVSLNATNKTGVTKVTLNGDANRQASNYEETVVVRRPLKQVSNTSTLPRNNANRYSMPAPPSAALLRSTSITQLEAQQRKSETESATIVAPFGQNTLRRTGLKEKILAREEEAQKKAKQGVFTNNKATQKSTQNSTYAHINQSTNQTKPQNVIQINATNGLTNGHSKASVTTDDTQQINSPIKPQTKTLQSAKLQLNLQQSTNVYMQQLKGASLPKSLTPKSAPIVSSTAPPPPPPLQPILKSTQGQVTSPTASDPRDQLLAAIRNFKRDDLNRA